MPSPTASAATDRSERLPRARRSLRRRLARRVTGFLWTLAAVGAAALAIGFFGFLHAVPQEEAVLRESADGIVVLTGGTARIPDAMNLLAAGRGKRLLITGVNRSTTPREIIRLVPEHERLVACCVDLDYSAVNTVGNAAETRRWATEQNFRSLIVVTSSYHMPRTMAELGHQLTGIRLIPFPVVTDRLRTGSWWSDGPTARLLISEYLKYVVARLRMQIELAPGTEGVARSRSHSRS